MMNIVYSGNKRVFVGVMLSMASVLKYNNDVNFYILGISGVEDSLDESDAKYFDDFIKFTGRRGHAKYIECNEAYEAMDKGGANADTGFTPFSFTRLLIGKVLPNVEHCLWLDADTVVNRSIESWYYNNCATIDIGGSYSEGIYNTGDIENTLNFREFVSGIIFMNLEYLRGINFFDKAIEILKSEPLRYPDQMALSRAYKSLTGKEIFSFGQEVGWGMEMWKVNESMPPLIYHFVMELVNDKPYYNGGLPNFKKKFPQFKEIYKLIDNYADMLDNYSK